MSKIIENLKSFLRDENLKSSLNINEREK